MDNNELMHYGILGMKWGIRRTPEQLGRKSKSNSKENEKYNSKNSKKITKSSSNSSSKKSVKDMSDAELREKINRLQLEKQYKDLTKSDAQSSKAKAFVADVLEKSGKNVATQLTTYVIGTAVNKAFKSVFDDDSIINPKKGQKDK